ncbi:beta-defensin 104A-like [Sminthopsis crassicaudata]|uniref:beta-defensin 104A-like n=1 Tax=Sminthopsis crassicaudata TaxID=9301 RepID=UPI003D68505C
MASKYLKRLTGGISVKSTWMLWKVRSGLEDKVCGYGTALCRVTCLSNEIKIGKCPNAFPCCLKTFENHSLNTLNVNS